MEVSKKKMELSKKFLGDYAYGHSSRSFVVYRNKVYSMELDGWRKDMYDVIVEYRSDFRLLDFIGPSINDMLTLYRYIYKNGRLEVDFTVLNGVLVRK